MENINLSEIEKSLWFKFYKNIASELYRTLSEICKNAKSQEEIDTAVNECFNYYASQLTLNKDGKISRSKRIANCHNQIKDS